MRRRRSHGHRAVLRRAVSNRLIGLGDERTHKHALAHTRRSEQQRQTVTSHGLTQTIRRIHEVTMTPVSAPSRWRAASHTELAKAQSTSNGSRSSKLNDASSGAEEPEPSDPDGGSDPGTAGQSAPSRATRRKSPAAAGVGNDARSATASRAIWRASAAYSC